MSYEELKQTAAIICIHISYPERPILYATGGVPSEPADRGWQFLCGIEPHDDVSCAKVWLLKEVADLDPTVRSILDSEQKFHLSVRLWQRRRVAWRTAKKATRSSGAHRGGHHFVIPTEVEESLNIVWPLFDQKYPEMFPIRPLRSLSAGLITPSIRARKMDATSRCRST